LTRLPARLADHRRLLALIWANVDRRSSARSFSTRWTATAPASYQSATLSRSVTRVLVGHGIHPRASRSAAIFALAGQVPAPVLADLVAISTGKAAAWAKLAARDWSDYVANRAARRW